MSNIIINELLKNQTPPCRISLKALRKAVDSSAEMAARGSDDDDEAARSEDTGASKKVKITKKSQIPFTTIGKISAKVRAVLVRMLVDMTYTHSKGSNKGKINYIETAAAINKLLKKKSITKKIVFCSAYKFSIW